MQSRKSSFALNILKGAAVMFVLFFTLGAFADSQTIPEVTKTKPTVSFTGAPLAALDHWTFTVTAKDSSEPAHAAAITASGSCSISGDTVTIKMTTSTGTCKLTAKWAADADYLAATATQQTVADLAYTENTIYSFGTNYPDGIQPLYEGMVMDKAGNLYGVVAQDTDSSGPGYGPGTVFELTPKGSGDWTESILHFFQANSISNPNEGQYPHGSLALDSKGNLHARLRLGVPMGLELCGSFRRRRNPEIRHGKRPSSTASALRAAATDTTHTQASLWRVQPPPCFTARHSVGDLALVLPWGPAMRRLRSGHGVPANLCKENKCDSGPLDGNHPAQFFRA